MVAETIVRELSEADLPALVRIHNAINPDVPTTVDEVRHEISRIDRRRYISEWMVATTTGGDEVVAYGGYRHVPWAHHPEKFFSFVNVHPDHQGRGIGSRLMDEILSAVMAHGGRRLKAWTREDRSRAVAFLQRYEFVEQAREFESRLDVAGVNLDRFRDYQERAARLGVTITTLQEELRRDTNCLEAVYQAHCVLDMGVPGDDPEPPTPPTQEEFLAQEVRHPRVLPDAFFLAKMGDLYVGESALKRSDGDPGLLHQQLTAVLPAYRGQGIAVALKAATIAYAQERGYRVIRTFNSSHNEAMLAINAKFGFVRMPAWVTFTKRLEG
ncbi:MAG: GNAT family N-acetyltransferase [Armatimonadetes bacterium]|nr:GNAT family N-acetyltransferase [Armatimonadota bacterium]